MPLTAILPKSLLFKKDLILLLSSGEISIFLIPFLFMLFCCVLMLFKHKYFKKAIAI